MFSIFRIDQSEKMVAVKCLTFSIFSVGFQFFNFQRWSVGFEQRLERIPGDCSQDGCNQVAANHDDNSDDDDDDDDDDEGKVGDDYDDDGNDNADDDDDDVKDAQERAGEVRQQVHPGSCLENQLCGADGLAHVPGGRW